MHKDKSILSILSDTMRGSKNVSKVNSLKDIENDQFLIKSDMANYEK